QSLPSQRYQVLKYRKVIGFCASQSRDRMSQSRGTQKSGWPNSELRIEIEFFCSQPATPIRHFSPRGFVKRRALRMHQRARTVAVSTRAKSSKSIRSRALARFATVLCRTGVADATNGTGDRFR